MGNQPNPTITLNQSDPHYNETVSFTLNNAPTDGKKLVAFYLRCSQGDTLVYASGGWPIQLNYTLRSNAWTGGAATAKATLVTFSANNPSQDKVIAELDFNVLA